MYVWTHFLYTPVFNLLIWIYNNWTEQNFGWAVVYLNIILRIVLLPFTLVTERARMANKALSDELQKVSEAFAADPIAKKEEVRRVLRKRRVQPWAKAVVLVVQFIVLVLLYQVFLRGITGEKIMKILYPSIDFPGKINTIFFGFDLGQAHDVIWSGVVAVWLALEIYFDMSGRKGVIITKSDLVYFVAFPLFVFLALWWLPMVKSLFILTSMIFSTIVAQFSKLIFKPAPSGPAKK
jgi:membrane protein insertase Oxa1/YidC/SpoIIIJ